ncbi:MAG: hypothetical protein JNL97_03785, partial [Verrucomicrobiales bacterium]|nr:hypothetical protein [Verrucomicrobiales bacterium]
DDDAPVVRGTNVTVIALRTETAIASVVFSLSQPSPEPIRVPYATVDDTAVAPDDYSPSRGVLVFLPGETQRGLEIPVAPNSAGEGIERFRVRLEAPTNAVLERVEILVELLPEPEPNRPPQVRLLAPEDALEVTVGSAIDVVAEASDPEGSPVSVAFRAGDLTLGEQSAAPYRIRWVPSSTGTFELTAIATDDAGLSSGSTPVRVRVEPLPTLTAFPVSTAESSGAARVPVTLSRASRDVVTVHVATREATARAGSDFAARAETLTFQPGQTNLVVGIDVLDDDTPETAETFLIDFGSPTNTTIATRTIAVEITDDDLPPSTNHPPSVVLAAPADLDVVRPGDAVRVRAEAVDVDGPVVRVEFFVDDRLAATDTEAPFEWEWRPVQPGDYRIGARAVDREGASGEARPVRLAVTDSCGRVAIVTPGRDAETDRLREYLFELGQPSSVFERSTSRPEHFLGFDLVIWRDDGRAVLSAEDVRLAKALAATGVPAYYAGERVVDAHRSLDTESQADWLELIGMRPGVPEDVPDRVEISDDDLPGSVSPIVRGGKVGDVGGFAYPFAFSIGSRSEPNGEVVLATAGTTAVLVASADDTDSGVRRRVTQAFSVTESGDEASRAARKRLFQNAVWWLLNCSSCANLNLVPFVSIDPAPAPETDHFAVTIRVHATGACEALGVRTVCELSPNLRFVRATATRGFWEADAAIGMVTFFLGRIPSASDEIIEMILRPVRSGDVSVDVRLESLNEAVGALEDNRTEISARADGPPGLV